MMKFTKEEKETKTMTNEGHCRGSEISHIRKKKEIQEDDRESIELAKDIFLL